MSAASGVITITTDFGHQGPFVGVMKGTILKRFAAARLIDLTHEILVHWPAEAGFWLSRSYGYFPPGTVHLAVVDPGVGTARGVLVVAAGGHYFVAPDNGLLAPVVSRAGEALIVQVGKSQLAGIGAQRPSATFHGRDIFALVHAGNHSFSLRRTYGDTRPGEYLALVNSFGVIEIARAEDSAAEGLGLSRGAPVVVRDRTDQP
jgi:S-adenosylmethionine hydrolase